MSQVPTVDSVLLKRSQIFVNWEKNYRRSDPANIPKIEEMAALLRASGQLSEVGVEELPEPLPTGETHELTYGYRRIAAWDLLGWTDKKYVRCARKKYKKSDVGGRTIDNLNANHHVRPPLFDTIDAVAGLANGTLNGGAKLDRAELMTRTGLSEPVLRKYLKVASAMHPEVREAARAHSNFPIRVALAIAAIKGEGDTPAERSESKRQRQETALNHWVATKKELAQAGKVRARRSNGADNDESENALSGGPGDEDDGTDAGDGGRPTGIREVKPAAPMVAPARRCDKKGHTVETYMRALERRLDETKGKEARARLQGGLAVFEFFTGKRKQLPTDIVCADDLKAIEAEDAPSAKAS